MLQVLAVRARVLKDRGFVFLWVLITVALIGLALATAAEIYRTQRKRDVEVELLFVGQQFRLAIERYYEATPGPQKRYPTSVDDLLRDPRFPGARRHLRRLYRDPTTGSDEWGLIRLGSGIVGLHSLSEQTPLKVDNFEPSDASFTGKDKYSDWKFTFPPEGSAAPSPPPDARGPGNTALLRPSKHRELQHGGSSAFTVEVRSGD